MFLTVLVINSPRASKVSVLPINMFAIMMKIMIGKECKNIIVPEIIHYFYLTTSYTERLAGVL